MDKRITLSILFAFYAFFLTAQIELTEAFRHRLDQLGADIIRPLDSDFRPTGVEENDFFRADFTLYSRKEKLEIRYRLVPQSEMGPMAGMPHIHAGRLVANVGSNDDDAVTSVHSFLGEDFATFRADWAKLYTFRPKLSLSDRRNAQLVSLYREGLGMIYVLLLFDKAPESLPFRQLAARFIE